jgi:hypothetical protein
MLIDQCDRGVPVTLLDEVNERFVASDARE